MLPKLKISSHLLKRLISIRQQCSGCLFGIFYGDSTLLLLGFNIESTLGQLNYKQIQHKFPAELDLCGLVKIGDCTDAEAHMSEIFKDVDITDNPILLQCQLGSLVDLNAKIFMHGKLRELPEPYEIMEADQLVRDFCFTRITCSVDMYTEGTAQAVRRDLNAVRKMLSGGNLSFKMTGTDIHVNSFGTHGCSRIGKPKHLSNESSVSDLIAAVADVAAAAANADNKENQNENRKKSSSASAAPTLASVFGVIGCDFDIINIDVLRCKTRATTMDETSSNKSDSSSDGSLPAVSMCIACAEDKISIPIEVEAMAILCKSTNAGRLYDVLIESVCRALRLYEFSLLENFTATESLVSELQVPRIYYFYVSELGHFLSCAYLEGRSDDDPTEQEKRKLLHRHFGLPVTRPYFRRINRCIYRSELSKNDGLPLLNTHVGVKPSGINAGNLFLVQGNYYYYHYLQQGINDKGWGCAYRSLQSIFSWFRLQGYTDIPVPTHRQIQQHLVDIGDKPSTFVGSSQWIGSTEVSMVLQGLLNVDSRILRVETGAEMATIAVDLVMHFTRQGTPIMIGGGVLAHTIIGIDYNAENNQVKFLILDPHYTGEDDLATIQAKGWCGWKGIEFWDKKSFYNLCMPQRPIFF